MALRALIGDYDIPLLCPPLKFLLADTASSRAAAS